MTIATVPACVTDEVFILYQKYQVRAGVVLEHGCLLRCRVCDCWQSLRRVGRVGRVGQGALGCGAGAGLASPTFVSLGGVLGGEALFLHQLRPSGRRILCWRACRLVVPCRNCACSRCCSSDRLTP